MKAMVLERPGAIESEPLVASELAVPEPQEREVLVRVEACAICRTDLHVIAGELPPRKQRIVPGHQVVGTIERRGPGAQRFREGERVGIAWLRYTCGKCRYCVAGHENLCPNAAFTGWDENGGYAQYAVVREDFAYAIPAAFDPISAAPLLCAGIIGFRALRRAEVRPGCRLGLWGFGSSAHVAIQVARHWGCTIYVMTRDERHRALARELGAAWTGPADAAPPEPVDSGILFAPVGSLVPHALESLDMGGTLALAGIYLTDIPPLNYERHLFHEKNLRSVTANTREDGEALLKVAAEIPIKPQTTSFALQDANRVLRLLKSDALRGTGVLCVP